MAQSSETHDALFVNLVMIFKTAAFQQLGKTLNPMTGKVEKNLEQARFSIDMIEMLKDKTRGNLSEDLSKLVDSTLLELRMNYVEEANAGDAAGDSEAAGASGQAEDASGTPGDTGSGADKGDSRTGTGEVAGKPEADPEESPSEKPEDADSGTAGASDEKKGPQGD